MVAKREWVITTSADHPIGEITKAALAAGFTPKQVLTEIGCIIGHCDEQMVGKLRSIPGVVDVSPSTDVNIGPPGSPSTW